MAVKAASNELTLMPEPAGVEALAAGALVAAPLQAATMMDEAATAAMSVARVFI
jgi:hypothetical protein